MEITLKLKETNPMRIAGVIVLPWLGVFTAMWISSLIAGSVWKLIGLRFVADSWLANPYAIFILVCLYQGFRKNNKKILCLPLIFPGLLLKWQFNQLIDTTDSLDEDIIDEEDWITEKGLN